MPIIEEVTKLYPVSVAEVFHPRSSREVQNILKAYPGKISVGGGRYSMGGQTAIVDGAQIDMRDMNQVLSFSKEERTITVETGIRWRDIEDYIAPHGLAIEIMQTYSNFTVGGSLSVNVHGRYIGKGALVMSILSIRVVLADGSLVLATPEENSEIFYAAIGGYGGIGVICEATLQLAENCNLERITEVMDTNDYRKYFFENVRESGDVVFHNGDIYPPHFFKTRITSWIKTDKSPTVNEAMIPRNANYGIHRFVYGIMTHTPFGKWMRENIIDPLVYRSTPVHTRTYEASYDVAELEPKSRAKTSYVLQEYFVPAERFDDFVVKMAEIFTRYDANIINVSIRHAFQDPGTLLAWAQQEVFAFVVYYNQKTDDVSRAEVAVWTRELVNAAISVGGRYYLPYQIHMLPSQFRAAYPRSDEYFATKKRLDPTGKFSNSLWEAYAFAPNLELNEIKPSNFHTVFESVAFRDKFFLFLQNVFHIAPTRDLHYAIWQMSKQLPDDQSIYRELQTKLPAIKPMLADVRYGLPALAIQKAEMVRETMQLLGDRRTFAGYLEIGGAGRYTKALRKEVSFAETYLITDEPIDKSPVRIVERGQLGLLPHTRTLSYEISDFDEIPDGSLELVTMYIGLHHCPLEKLDAFLKAMTSKMKSGGVFVLRDHNVESPVMHSFVALAHDVFNAGVGAPWEANAGELRHFRSVSEWVKLLATYGLTQQGEGLLQANDPTDNTLMSFVFHA